MKMEIVLALATTAVLTTGCESTKAEVEAKDFIAIVHNIASMACTSFAIDEVKKDFGYTGTILYHEEANNVTCEDYGRVEGDTCKVKTYTDKSSSGYGDRACVLGTDDAPTK